jgi:3-methylcrotonyl-CoA carboxylase alpha subunit
MDAETREAVCGAAVRAAQAVNYENAGTIEFIADASEGLRADRIWFMEMNTRLQVEHPVTEEITGQDLVEWQLRVASGEKLPKRQEELSINGHAIEARLYAEDPAKGFLPSVGRLEWLAIGAGEGRVETGVEQGGEVSSFYDPMIAKLVNSGGTRDEAREKLAAKLANINVWPVRTNAGFLYRAVTNPEFAAAKIDTGFMDRHLDELFPPAVPSEEALEAGLEALRWNANFDDEPAHVLGFRLNAEPRRRAVVSVNGQPAETPVGYPMHKLRVDEPTKDRALVNEAGQTYAVTFLEPRGTDHGHGIDDGEIEAPMPGKVTAVEVSQGEKVAKGQRLLTLEAMKMEHALTAPFDGTVAELNAKSGAQVTEGQLLVKVEPEEQPSS